MDTTVLLRSEQSGGQVSVIENVLAAGAAGPYLHTHDFDEAFYVLEGELTFRVEDELLTATAGDVEHHFARIAARSEGVEPPDWALQEIPEVVRVGPRIGEES